MATHIGKLLSAFLHKPLKIDIRNVCEHNMEGPITRTFTVPRKEVIRILQESESKNIVDRVDITEYPEESRFVVYNKSQMDSPVITPIRQISVDIKEWELEPQYGNRFAGDANDANGGEDVK